jgi:hypothetical protein
MPGQPEPDPGLQQGKCLSKAKVRTGMVQSAHCHYPQRGYDLATWARFWSFRDRQDGFWLEPSVAWGRFQTVGPT